MDFPRARHRFQPVSSVRGVTATSELRVTFSGAASEHGPGTCALHAPWLAGAEHDALFDGAIFQSEHGAVRLYRQRALSVGCLRVPFAPGSLAPATRDAYRQVLAAVGSRRLYRVWHFVPRINDDTAGIENYRAFCQGRSLAFEEHFGTDYRRQLCAASAVGCDGAELELVFVAGDAAPRHCENPEQVPAYDYPPEHGPRSPSFARATVVETAGRRITFVSGTSSIKGHATVGGALARQIDCTLDNLRLISEQAGLGPELLRGAADERHFKIYLRRATDLPAVQQALRERLIDEMDRVIYLRADICRAALDIEIEATLVESRR